VFKEKSVAISSADELSRTVSLRKKSEFFSDETFFSEGLKSLSDKSLFFG
jgi:hypothetical protein